MSDKTINLNRVRKERAKARKRARADENVARFGRTKAERSRDETMRTLEGRNLDQHRREDDER